MEKQHPTASTPIHDNLATSDFVTQPLVSPIQNHLTLPPVLPKATTGVNNIHGMPPHKTKIPLHLNRRISVRQLIR